MFFRIVLFLQKFWTYIQNLLIFSKDKNKFKKNIKFNFKVCLESPYWQKIKLFKFFKWIQACIIANVQNLECIELNSSLSSFTLKEVNYFFLNSIK